MRFRFIFVALCFITVWSSTPVLTLDCYGYDLKNKTTCDDCIQCGGTWCKNINEPTRCVGMSGGGDDWCTGNYRDTIVFVPADQQSGDVFNPKEQEKLAEINSNKITELKIDNADYHQYIKTAKAKVVSTSQSSGESKVNLSISTTSKSIRVTTKIQRGFCSSTSEALENVTVEVSMEGVEEKAVLTYRVPCRCGCSANAEPRAPECNNHGKLVCGACQCDPGRHGERCECGEPSLTCIDDSIPVTEKCSGNGRCDKKCNRCVCNEGVVRTPGTERFDPENNCKDIITSTIQDYFDCVKLPCGSCDYDIVHQKWNSTLLDDRDGDRKLWANVTVGLSPLWATNSNGKIYMMREPQPPCL